MKIRLSVCLLFLFMITMSFAGCGVESPSSTKYWFSKYDSNFVAYNFENDNINEAGTYWNFTVAKNVNITLNVRVDIDSYSVLSLSKNKVKVEGKAGSGIYTSTFDLSLKKGDKIEMHARWTNTAKTNDNGFEIQLLSVTQNGQTYLLSEFNKSTTM